MSSATIPVQASDERARSGSALTDAVTFSFADPVSELYGLARLGLSGSGDARRGSVLAVLFSGRTPVTAVAQGDIPVAADADWQALSLPGLAATVEAPLERWSVRLAGERDGFALSFTAASPPAGHEEVGGMVGYEQLCRVRGEVAIEDRVVAIDCAGQRGHSWGAPDWRRLDAVHTVAAWLQDGSGAAVQVAREAGAKGHGAAARWGALLGAGGAVALDDPRVSTTYDGAGRQRRAGLELWEAEDEAGFEAVHRAAGTVICGSTLELGQLRLDCAFMRWTMEGVAGVGRYDVLRRA
ncbi:MAG TPA: hypothetical protein VF533_17370 [Solirubrobacteraceae bacterium]